MLSRCLELAGRKAPLHVAFWPECDFRDACPVCAGEAPNSGEAAFPMPDNDHRPILKHVCPLSKPDYPFRIRGISVAKIPVSSGRVVKIAHNDPDTGLRTCHRFTLLIEHSDRHIRRGILGL